MKLAIYTIATIALLAVAGCTADDYDGCHGTGCLVDRPQKRDRSIDNRPQFDRNGNPNFDTQGNYEGCHGVGCEVDTPDDSSSSDDDDIN